MSCVKTREQIIHLKTTIDNINTSMIEVSDIAIQKLLERNVKSVRLGVTGNGYAGLNMSLQIQLKTGTKS